MSNTPFQSSGGISAGIFKVRDGWNWEAKAPSFDPPMDLSGWAEDALCARIHCTQEQVRWLMRQRMPVNLYVVPELPA